MEKNVLQREARSPYLRIRDAIIEGTFPPGSALGEQSLAEWCGVSRTPVREALRGLEQDGLVERTARGLIVTNRTPEQILDTYDVRIVLEESVARFAAERHTQIDRIRLESLIRASSDPKPGDQLARRNHRFHRTMWAASHNDALIDVLSRLHMHLTRFPATTLSYERRWEQTQVEHRELVEAVVARDAESAAQLARAHFERARDIRLKLWQQDIP
ncbi:GntR family transcriptional regulator [Jiangella asiatica]|uniref:GntR family transcriptional regulator n=1 Tax=Jiangella asiatica TaxID=2530372 RepID=A0A4R5DBW2_9ACTN|nr:GntR family transcriptional regulator [Jiangella asiatica]TDE08025.1 GntR family transcriptional regulator [Jiangella asiatica]